MKSIGKKLLLLSFFLALVSTITIFYYLQSLKTSKDTDKKITILVANETIPARIVISNKMLKEIKVPDNSIFKDYINDSSQIIGKYSKDTIMKNEGFRKENLLSKNGDEISIKIDNNHRAVSINVTGASAVSDLLKAGDYVDVIAYLPEKKELAVIIRPESAKFILQNVEVLAVDKQVNRDDNSKETIEAKIKIPTTFFVTLSVPLLDIEKLVLAEDTGSLKLALRPLNKEDQIDSKGATWQDLIVKSSSSQVNSPIAPVNNTSSANNSKTVIKFINYTVKQGDTLRIISSEFYGDSDMFTLIKAANNIQDENQIITGEVIKIPLN